jgi:hypothetical protein
VNIAIIEDTKTEKALGFLTRFLVLPFGDSFHFIVGKALTIFTDHVIEVFEFVASKKTVCSRKHMSWDARRERVM